jgi:hypothetical protein
MWQETKSGASPALILSSPATAERQHAQHLTDVDSARSDSPGDAVMVWFERYSYFVLLYSLLAPAVPWIFARKHGRARVWGCTGIALVLLVGLHASLWPVCIAANCGQGAILLAGLVWPLGAVFCMATLAVGVAMALARR